MSKFNLLLNSFLDQKIIYNTSINSCIHNARIDSFISKITLFIRNSKKSKNLIIDNIYNLLSDNNLTKDIDMKIFFMLICLVDAGFLHDAATIADLIIQKFSDLKQSYNLSQHINLKELLNV